MNDKDPLLPPPRSDYLIEAGDIPGPSDAMIAGTSMPEAQRIHNGHMDIPLAEIEAPIVDGQTFFNDTNIPAELVATMQIGRQTIGIIDRNAFFEKRGQSKNGLLWDSPDTTQQSLITKEDVFAVKLKTSDTAAGGYEVIEKDNGVPDLTALSQGKIVSIGRSAENSVTIDPNDDRASREHLALSYNAEAGTVRVDDFSTTATEVFVNYADEDVDRTIPSHEIDEDKTAEVPIVRLGALGVENRISQEVLTPASDVGVAELGKYIGGEYRMESEDTLLNDSENDIYGVFDGAGGHADGKKASHIAAKVAGDQLKANTRGGELSPSQAEYAIRRAFETADEAVENTTAGGITTGTMAKIYNFEGIDYLSWGSVGDSRIYVFKAAISELIQLSEDEGVANVLHNALGDGAKVEQIGSHMLEPGDQVLICSDGITGDVGTDILENDEIGRILSVSETAEKAAQDLAWVIARKNDDRAAVVIRPEIAA